MIIDAHSHSSLAKLSDGKWWEKEPVDNAKELIKEMDAYGVAMSITMQSHLPKEHEQIQRAVKKYPDRFIGFCGWSIDKDMNGKKAAEEVERWIKEPEFKGVGEALINRFRGNWGIDIPMHELMKEIRIVMDVVAAANVPIIFHTGLSGAHPGNPDSPLSYKDPIYYDVICKEYQNTPIIIGHSGGGYAPHYQNALLVAYDNENAYLETSKSRSDVIEAAVKEIGSSKILFGTDWIQRDAFTFGTKSERTAHLHERNIKVVEEARISDEDKERIFYKNIKSLLNLE